MAVVKEPAARRVKASSSRDTLDPPAEATAAVEPDAEQRAPDVPPVAPPRPPGSDDGHVDVRGLLALFALLGVCVLAFIGPFAQPGLAQPLPLPSAEERVIPSDWASQLMSLHDAAIRLPVAAALSTVLAYRPRRRGTPKRQLTVVQTQIILAIVGAIVMLVVGASLARAFGIVGAAGLIRYRAKVDDPKDAGVMLSTLALGLAAGVGQFALAGFATVFVLITLWILESLEPEPYALFDLEIAAKDGADALKSRIERTLRRHHVRYELRTTSPDELSYEVKVPLSHHTDGISAALVQIDAKRQIEVKWDKKKDK